MTSAPKRSPTWVHGTRSRLEEPGTEKKTVRISCLFWKLFGNNMISQRSPKDKQNLLALDEDF